MAKGKDTRGPERSAEHNPEDAPIIRSMTEDDAEGLSRCVKACYGDTYPAWDFYDSEKIRGFLRQGLLRSQIAVTREGEVVGHLGIMLDAMGDITADAVAGFVAPEYRGSDTMFRLGLNLNVVQQELNLIGVQLYALMLHSISHRKTLVAGGVETGLLPAHFPASTRPRGFERQDSASRIPAMLMYVPLRPAPKRAVYLPQRYADIIVDLYKQLKYTRSLKQRLKVQSEKPVSFAITKKSGLGIVQIKVQQAGLDLPDTIASLQRQFRRESYGVMYVDLPLCDPAAAAIIDGLRSFGFFYGGVIVERGGGDALRMQCLIDARIAPNTNVIASQRGKDLLSFVLADAHDVGAI